MSSDDLARVFSELSDEELLRRLGNASLTDNAQEVAKAEALARGLPVPPVTLEPEEIPDEYHGDLQTVAKMLTPMEAQLLVDCLQNQGIPAIASDANFVQAYSLLEVAVGGARVRVPEDFVAEAKQAIEACQRGEFTASDEDSSTDIVPEQAPLPERAPKLKTYRIYAHPAEPVSIVVREGFSWGAFLFRSLWFLFNKMWLNFIIVVCFEVGFNLGMAGFDPSIVIATFVFVCVSIGWCANMLLCSHLESRGYVLQATVQAPNGPAARIVARELTG